MKQMLKDAMDKMLPHSTSDGKMMEHEMPMHAEDNVMGMHNFKKGKMHEDSKATGHQHGDGKGNWTGH
jgi:hypothetical protein